MRSAADFWKLQPPTLKSMLLNQDASILDALERSEIFSILPPLQNKRVLELAAGIGRFTGELAKTASQVTAVDLTYHFLEQNKINNAAFSNINFLCKDAKEIDFPDQSFDLIFSHNLMMYLEENDVIELAFHMTRWLSPQGHLFMGETCRAVTQKIEITGLEGTYIAHHRSLQFYHQLFDPLLNLVKSGSMQVFIDYMANPFKCYWLYTGSC